MIVPGRSTHKCPFDFLSTMRVLTVRQPWAWLIINSTKLTENRSWRTNYRGPVLIHAGKQLDPRGFSYAASLGIDVPDDLPRGVILGHVQLVDVVRDSDSIWAEPGCFHWVLENPVSIEPIPYRGGQGLRRFIPGNARVTS